MSELNTYSNNCTLSTWALQSTYTQKILFIKLYIDKLLYTYIHASNVYMHNKRMYTICGYMRGILNIKLLMVFGMCYALQCITFWYLCNMWNIYVSHFPLEYAHIGFMYDEYASKEDLKSKCIYNTAADKQRKYIYGNPLLMFLYAHPTRKIMSHWKTTYI